MPIFQFYRMIPEGNPIVRCAKYVGPWAYKKLGTLLDMSVSSLRGGHANFLCLVSISSDDARRESNSEAWENVCLVDKSVLAWL